jgi:hypothetical protein
MAKLEQILKEREHPSDGYTNCHPCKIEGPYTDNKYYQRIFRVESLDVDDLAIKKNEFPFDQFMSLFFQLYSDYKSYNPPEGVDTDEKSEMASYIRSTFK